MGLRTLFTFFFVYRNAFGFAGPPVLFSALPHGFSFSIRFSAQVQAFYASTTTWDGILDLDPHITPPLPTTLTRLHHDNIYEFKI